MRSATPQKRRYGKLNWIPDELRATRRERPRPPVCPSTNLAFHRPDGYRVRRGAAHHPAEAVSKCSPRQWLGLPLRPTSSRPAHCLDHLWEETIERLAGVTAESGELVEFLIDDVGVSGSCLVNGLSDDVLVDSLLYIAGITQGDAIVRIGLADDLVPKRKDVWSAPTVRSTTLYRSPAIRTEPAYVLLEPGCGAAA